MNKSNMKPNNHNMKTIKDPETMENYYTQINNWLSQLNNNTNSNNDR